jgi:type VI secretion system protein VasD
VTCGARTFALSGLVAMSLAGCQAIPKIAEVVMNPSIPVGEDDEQPSTVALHAFAAADVNRTFDDEPAPVIVKVFALSSPHRFFSYDFFSLVDATEETLGVTLKGDLDEAMLEPGSYRILGPYDLPKGTREIAVIAEYADIDGTVWRASYPVADLGKDERLLMLLLEEEVQIMADGDGEETTP